jgi:polysaccharide export outer membrane protein
MHNQNSCENQSGLPIYAWRWLWKLFAVASVMLLSLSIASSQDDSKLQADSKPPISRTLDEKGTKHADEGFVIGAEDLLAINVWKEPDISRSIPVRSDGKITLPLIGELQASGKTPSELQQEIAGKLQSFISEPEVTVIVQEIRSQRFNILGQVAKPGSYQLANSGTVLDAIAVAGGFRDFAKKKSIYVLRQGTDGKQERLPFNYNDVIKGKNPEQNVRLMPRDTIVVR